MRLWSQEIELSTQTGKKFVASHPVTYWKSRMNRELTGDVLKRLSIPVLALNGSEDPFTPRHAFEPIHEVIMASHDIYKRASIIPNAGHSLLVQGETWKGSLLAQEIVNFLQLILEKK